MSSYTNTSCRPFLSCVVPAHNEVGNIAKVVQTLTNTFESCPDISGYEIIIVNDNSSDGTGHLIDTISMSNSHIQPVHREGSPGFGNAIKAGIKQAIGDIIIPVMGDLSDDPRDIIIMIQKLDEGYDIVYGSRFIHGSVLEDYPPAKWIANRVFNNVIRLLFGLQNKDITNAFKAYRREVFDEITVDSLEASGFDLTIEIPLKAHIAGFKSVEIPAHWYNRTEGEAKLKLSRNATVYGKRLIKLFFWGNLISLRDLFESVVKGSIYGTIFALLLGICAIVAIFSLSGFSEVFNIIKTVSLSYAILGVLILVLSFILRTWRWSVILRGAGYVVPSGALFKSIMFGSLLNYLLPARIGDIARAVALKVTDHSPLGVNLSTIIVERAFDTFSLGVLMTIIGLFFYKPEYIWLESGAILLTVGLLSILFILYYGERFIVKLLLPLIPNIESSITILNTGMREISRNVAALILILLLSVLIWFCDIFCIYISAQSIHYEISLLTVTVAGLAAFIAQSLPLTPGGIGVHEASIVGIMMMFQIPVSIGMSIALVDHFIRAAVVYCLGILCTIHLGFSSRAFYRNKKGKVQK